MTVTKFPEMPDFLKRKKDNTLAHPAPWGKLSAPPVFKAVAPTEDLTTWSDERIHAALSDNMTVAARQPLFREYARREKKIKAAQRIAALKASMAEREETAV